MLHNSQYPIFGTLESLKQLPKSDNDHLFFDGMFKSYPNPFHQLYSVQLVNSELLTPKLYVDEVNNGRFELFQRIFAHSPVSWKLIGESYTIRQVLSNGTLRLSTA